MIIYENTKGGFVQDVRSGSIASKVQSQFIQHGITEKMTELDRIAVFLKCDYFDENDHSLRVQSHHLMWQHAVTNRV